MRARRIAAAMLGACLASGCGSTGPAAGPTADKKNVAPKSGLAACSTRLPLVKAPKLAPSGPPEQILKSSFSAERLLGIEENVEVIADPAGGEAVLRVQYPKGSVNFGSAKKGRPLGGASFYVPFAGGDVSCLHYRVRFPEGFAFVKGGKLPGLYGGDAPSGGEEVTGSNGWSVRLMWRTDGAGELYEYIVNKKDDYGLSAGRGVFTFPRGRWVDVDLEVDLNDPGKANGIARLWIDGRAVIEQNDLVYTTRGADGAGGGLMFSTFFGGGDDSWASPKDQYVDFADFRLYAKEPKR